MNSIHKMSSSEDSDYSVKRRVSQKHKKVVVQKKHVVVQSKRHKYSSDSESSSDNYTDDDSDSQGHRDDDNNQEEQHKSQEKQNAAPSSGFCLPGPDEEPKIFVLVGSCASGKSYMLKYIMSLYGARRQLKFGLTFTSTKFTGDYSYLPDESVREFDMEYLERYIMHLRKKIEIGKKEHGPKWNLPHNFLIIDDSLGLTASSGFFTNFIATHRHTRTTVFLLSQLLTAARSVSTVVRANTSYAMMFPTSMQNAIEGLWKNYGQMYTMKDFKKELDKCRERKYSCLVFSNNPDFTTPEQAYHRICAPANVPDFELHF